MPSTDRPARGRLKVYLGATPGCGKTYAMLREGRDRREEGEDVVIGLVEFHGRPRTAAIVGGLEIIPRVEIGYRGTRLTDMDVEAVIARSPDVVLVDELAHTNAPGLEHVKRWQDVEKIRAHGIDVITTINIQHLESLKDVVESITGIRVQETVPDTVLDSADEIQFVDITPEALRKRMTHGNVYPQERVESALRGFFRVGNLAALRELALRFVADRTGATLTAITAPPEDVLVAITESDRGEALLRRGARLARARRGICSLSYLAEDGSRPSPRLIELAETLGCAEVTPSSGDFLASVRETVHALGVRHLVLGRRPGGRWSGAVRTVVSLAVDLPDVDLHVVVQRSLSGDVTPDGRPNPDALLHRIVPTAGRAELRLYLGYVAGCGATTAMIAEAERRATRGRDVLCLADSDPDASSGERRARWLRRNGAPIDIDAILARNPEVAAVDNIADRTADGRSMAAAVPRLRAAGITVIGTVTLTDVESAIETLGDAITRPAGRAIVPDALLDAADELELVDAEPSVVRERLREGLIAPPAEAARLLQHDYRGEVLGALRELAYRRVAQHTDRVLLEYMANEQIRSSWEARPRLLVCLPPRPGYEKLIEDAARHARSRDDALTVLCVKHGHRDTQQTDLLGAYASLTHQHGGEFVTVSDRDVVAAITDYASGHRITEVMMMRGRRRHRSAILAGLLTHLGPVTLHLLAAPQG